MPVALDLFTVCYAREPIIANNAHCCRAAQFSTIFEIFPFFFLHFFENKRNAIFILNIVFWNWIYVWSVDCSGMQWLGPVSIYISISVSESSMQILYKLFDFLLERNRFSYHLWLLLKRQTKTKHSTDACMMTVNRIRQEAKKGDGIERSYSHTLYQKEKER